MKKLLLPIAMSACMLPAMAFADAHLMSMHSALEKLETHGYKVEEIKMRSDHFHVEAYDKNCHKRHLRIGSDGKIMTHDGKATSNDKHMSAMEVARMLEDQGYKVKEIEFEHDHIEVEVKNKDGKKKEMKLNPLTGKAM